MISFAIKNSYLFFSLFFSLPSIDAQEATETPFEYTKRIYKELEKLKNLKPEEYLQNIDQYRESLSRYIDHKKRVCQGEFSTIIFNQGPKNQNKVNLETQENSPKTYNKLTKSEKDLCYRELKAIQTAFISNNYEARKKYMEYTHEQSLIELLKVKNSSLRKLNSSFRK